jgi:hypothetical protein
MKDFTAHAPSGDWHGEEAWQLFQGLRAEESRRIPIG